MHKNGKKPDLGLWIPLGPGNTLEIIQGILNCICNILFFCWLMVSWKFVILFVMFEFSCVLEIFTKKKKGSGRKTLISSTA